MKKKIIAIVLCTKLSFGFTVTDPASYVYFMEQIAQMTEVVQGITKQIETLGGIQTAVDDTKRQIYDMKDNLEGAFTNLQDSLKDLREVTQNTEVKSLFSLSRDSIKTNSSEGILYKEISEELQSYFVAADEAVMNRFDKAKLKAFDEEMKKLNKALQSNSLKDFESHLEKVEYDKISENLLIKDYLANLNKQGKNAIRQLALKQNNDIWNKYFVPNEEEEKKRKQREEKLSKYIGYIETSSDLYQQTQTTNMILTEILTVLKEEYKSAISFRNAMALMYLENSNNNQFLEQLKKNRTAYGTLVKGQKPQISSRTNLDKLPSSNPWGFDFRPF
ncbi:MAG: hypothetical protein ACNI3H_00640 [Halarcobacter ebronensis]|uniref:hypothetical protein n=1 Tax=Halarcobacter ebronensis TaxID=1462615 RepID=UPI003C7713B8